MLAFVVVFTVLDLLLALAITAIGGLALMALGW